MGNEFEHGDVAKFTLQRFTVKENVKNKKKDFVTSRFTLD